MTSDVWCWKVVCILCLNIMSGSRFCNKIFCRHLNSLQVCSIFRLFKTCTLLYQNHLLAHCAKIKNIQCRWDTRTSNFISVLKSVGLNIWQALLLHITLDLLHQCKKKPSVSITECCNVGRVSFPNTEAFSLTSTFCSAQFLREMFCDKEYLLNF